MNMDSVNKWLTLAANLGVIAGIVFLALEVNQNNLMMRTQTRSDISTQIQTILFDLSRSDYSTLLNPNPDLDLEVLDEDDRIRVELHILGLLRLWENIHYQYRNGLYELSEFETEKLYWQTLINMRAYRNIFCNYQSYFSTEFSLEMMTLLESPCN